MGEVIEHIPNHALGLMREVARVLRPHGLLVLTTRSSQYLLACRCG
jgi:2-polyprenyl-3-methyl-5-hydroxy-6-metoxy-1,4-benzoquinol methylase